MAAGSGTSARRRLGDALLAGYPMVLARPAFRALFLVLLLGGTAHGMGMAYVSVWASETFEVGPQAVAVLFVVGGLTGALGNPLLGLLSDRFGWRRGLIIGQLAVTSLAFVGRTLAPDYATALVLVAFSGFGITGLALAMVNDIVSAMPEGEKRSATRILAVERTAWSMGIILGPAVAAAIATAAADSRPVFAAAALTQFVAIGMVCGVRAETGARLRAQGTALAVEAKPVARTRGKAMALLFVGMVLVTLPAQTRTMYMPLFVTTVLGEPRGMVGPLFTLTAAIVVVTMPYVGIAADRFGAQRVLYAGALLGAVYCLLQAGSSSYVQTAAVQLLVGLGIALWSTSTLIYLQQSMPGRAGSAGGLYVAVQQVTPLLGGLLLGPIAEASDIPAAFATTAVLCLVALALLARAHHALVGGRPSRAVEPELLP